MQASQIVLLILTVNYKLQTSHKQRCNYIIHGRHTSYAYAAKSIRVWRTDSQTDILPYRDLYHQGVNISNPTRAFRSCCVILCGRRFHRPLWQRL